MKQTTGSFQRSIKLAKLTSLTMKKLRRDKDPIS